MANSDTRARLAPSSDGLHGISTMLRWDEDAAASAEFSPRCARHRGASNGLSAAEAAPLDRGQAVLHQMALIRNFLSFSTDFLFCLEGMGDCVRLLGATRCTVTESHSISHVNSGISGSHVNSRNSPPQSGSLLLD
jgi:hypothetical protein